MDQKKCPTIVLCILFALWFLVLPAILGIVLYIRNIKIDKAMVDEVTNTTLKIEELKQLKQQCQSEYDEILHTKENLLNQMQQEAKEQAENEIREKLDESNDTLKHLQQDIDTAQLLLKEKTEEYEKSIKNIESNAKKVDKLKELYKSFRYAIKVYDSDEGSYLGDALLTTAEDNLSPVIEMKLNCMNVKQLKAKYNQLQSNIRESFKRYEGRYTTKANIAIYKLMVIALEAELQNVLYSLKYGKLEDSIESIKEITSRYLTIAVDGNQSIAPTMKRFIGEIEYLFLEAVKVEYKYYTQKERIKEEQRALRDQMRQEAEERKALEAQKKQVEKEESKYKTEIDIVTKQMENANAEELSKLKKRIEELQAQLKSVEERKDDITKLQNGKAGYVYVISNLGSFGDHVFKVGMTRRLEPMDRVKELGDASVPFSFDVHSFIFSDDAVSLENTLHKELYNKRVNKINSRKEFFDVSIDEIEELVYKYQPTAEFNRTMLAQEYKQGLSLIDELPELSDEELINV